MSVTQRSRRSVCRPVTVLVGVAAALLLGGCRTDVRVAVDVAPDGAGTVTVTATLDPEAASALGDPARLSVDDLAQAGWSVAEPESTDGGGLRLSVRRAFGSPSQLATVLAEVGGEDALFRGVTLEVEDSLASTAYRFATTIEATGDLSQFSDPELTAVLEGLPIGRTPEELATAGAEDPDAVTLVLSVALPGGTPETNGTLAEGRAEWRVPLTGGEPSSEDAASSSSVSKSWVTALLVAAGVLMALALVALVVGLVRRRRQ